MFCPQPRPSHARTVVRGCCKGDDESHWERGKFDTPATQKPLKELKISTINCRYLQMWIKCENGLPYICGYLGDSVYYLVYFTPWFIFSAGLAYAQSTMIIYESNLGMISMM